MPRICRAALLAALLAPAPAWAAPDFSKTEILVSTEAPLEADIVTFTVVLRNTGADDAGSVYFWAEWPLMGFLVDSEGFDGAEVDPEARRLTLTLPLAAGGERRFVVRVLAPRDSGGDALTLAIRATHFDSNTEHWDRKTVTVDSRLGSGGITLGGYRITPAGLATLGVLAGGALLWLVVSIRAGRSAAAGPATGAARTGGGVLASRVGPASAVAAVTIAVGFWAVFGAMAWRDYQSLTSWPQTTCTILGGRLSAQATTRTSRTSGTAQGRTDETTYVPVLGLKYLANGLDTYSSGYDTGSRIGIGGQGGRTDELSRWAVGGTAPCWYNPADPLDVVVLNGFGGAYLFALLPIPVFLIGAAGIRSIFARA
jgi:hypothetical protein